MRLVTSKEINEAMFDIGNDRALGPNGHSTAFFKANWEYVGGDVDRTVKEFFQSLRLLRSVNNTVVAFIPKTSSNPKVSEFLPIACCNVVYKIIMKIISKRMEPLLKKIVNPAQSTFVAGRNITDDVNLAQELMRGYDCARNTPRCTVKIDLRKAYDIISWEFLRDVLHGLKFHPLEWIMECVTTLSFSIAINGSHHGYFQGQRDLRQGDPMSPSLFILCMEYLSRLLCSRTVNDNFNYHPKCANNKITHLIFVDDLMLVASGDVSSMLILAKAMNEFSECSGLEINQDKSNVYTSGIQKPWKLEAVLRLFGFPLGSLSVRYLGIPLNSARLNITHFAPLIDKMTDLRKKWSGKTLSFAGRL